MKRILIIANYKGSVGGISSQVDELYHHLQEEGVDCAIFSTTGNLIVRIGLLLRLMKIARGYDVLHIHGCSYIGGMIPIILGVCVGKVWKKRIVVTYHGGEAGEYFAKHKCFARCWINQADVCVVLSEYLKEIFDKYKMPSIIIPNIVTFSTPLSRKISPRTTRFISVRHLAPLYNIPCILRAFEHVHTNVPTTSLTILGQGPMKEDLEQWIFEHHLVDCVTFVGQVPNTEISHYLSQSDVMLSAPHIDNMPVSVLEAMNAGVLVISSRVGGVPYIIDENRTGLFFADDNSDELAEKMIWAIEHSNDVQQMIDAAQIEVQKYKWDNIKNRLYTLYG